MQMMNFKTEQLNKKGTQRRLKSMTTYSLLVRSEDKNRGIFEIAIYGGIERDRFDLAIRAANGPFADR